MRKTAQFLTAIALGVAALGAQAQIVNGSFENYSVADGTSASFSSFAWAPTNGWGFTGSPTVVDPSSVLDQGVGEQFARLLNSSQSIYQSFTATSSGARSLTFLGLGSGTVSFGVNNQAPSASFAFNASNWTSFSINFASVNNETYRIVFGSSSGIAQFDGVGVGAAVVAVPEPETYAMMLAGLGAIGFLSRRRKQAA